MKLLDKPEHRLAGGAGQVVRHCGPSSPRAPGRRSVNTIENALSVALNVLLEKFVATTVDEEAAVEILKTVRERVLHAP
jgi:hypothetical protein